MGWLTGWSYAKEISLTGQTGAGTLFQVDLDIGDSAGGDFHLEGHCTNFPQDIEVTDDDGTTLLDFWIEDTTADPIKMWGEIADDLGSSQTIWIYYGKSGATTNSNGSNTFMQWHGTATADFLDALVISSSSYVYEVEARTTSTTGNNMMWGISNNAVWATGDKSVVQSHYDNNLVYHQTRNSGSGSNISEAPRLTLNQWYNGKIVYNGTTSRGYWDGNEISTGITTNIPNENMGLFMDLYAGTGEQKWSFARKHHAPEPAFSSAGAEQSAPTVGHPTMRRWGGIPGMQYTGRRSW